MALRSPASPAYRRPYYRRYYRRSYGPRRMALWKVPSSFPDVEPGLTRHYFTMSAWLCPRSPTGFVTSGHTSVQKFAINDLYDPDISGIGTSAWGFGRQSAIYSRYTVVASRLHLRAIPYSASSTGFVPTPGGSCITELESSLVLTQDPTTNPVPYGYFGKLHKSQDVQSVRHRMNAIWQASGRHNSDVVQMSAWYFPKKFWGATWEELLQYLSGSSSSWDPTLRCCAWFNMDAQGGDSTDYGTWQVDFRIDFWAKWFNCSTGGVLLDEDDKKQIVESSQAPMEQ